MGNFHKLVFSNYKKYELANEININKKVSDIEEEEKQEDNKENEKEEKEDNIESVKIYNYKKYNFKLKKIKNSDKIILPENKFKGINKIFFLKDGRLTLCTHAGSIAIFNKINYKLESLINFHETIYYHIQLLKGDIAACLKDGTLRIIKLKTLKVFQILRHKDAVCEVVERNANQIISVARDGDIYIWDKNNNGEYTLNHRISASYGTWHVNLVLINKEEVATGNKGDEAIKFWNKNTFENVKKIKIINYSEIMYFDEKTKYLYTYYNDNVILIDTIKHEIIGKIIYDSDHFDAIRGSKDGKLLVESFNKYENWSSRTFIINININEENGTNECEEIKCCEKNNHMFVYFGEKLMAIHC